MKPIFTKDDSKLATMYFLGQTTDAERDKIEDRFFIDEDYSYFLDETERDLIDNYVKGNLSEVDRKRFEQNYLVSDEREEKLKFSILFNERSKAVESSPVVSSQTITKSSWFDFLKMPRVVFAGALGVLLLFLVLIGILLNRNKTPEFARNDANIENKVPDKTQTPPVQPIENNSSNSGNNTSGNTSTNLNISIQNKNSSVKKPDNVNQTNRNPEAANEKPTNENKNIKPVQPTFASILLLPLSRSSEKPTVNINSSTKGLKLTIVCDNAQDFQTFKIEIINPSGEIVSQQTIKNVSSKPSKSFSIMLPAEKISNGQFEVNLSAIDKDNPPKILNFYEFNIIKK